MEIDSYEKKEILQELVKSEKETTDNLKELVKKAKNLFWIEGENGDIIITKQELSLSNKIKLQLIGSYFASELGLKNKKSCNVEDLKLALNTEGRALSRPLGELVKLHLISEDNGEYAIKYYSIEEVIDQLNATEYKKKTPNKRILKRKKQDKIDIPEKNEYVKELKEEGLQKLKEKTNAGDKIDHIFDFDKHDVRLIHPIISENVSESIKQYKATLLYLMALKYCYGLHEISSRELRKKLEDLGLKSLVNLSTNLKSFSSFIVHKKGAKGNTDTSYKITIPGEMEAIRIIKDLVSR